MWCSSDKTIEIRYPTFNDQDCKQLHKFGRGHDVVCAKKEHFFNNNLHHSATKMPRRQCKLELQTQLLHHHNWSIL